MFVIGSGGGFPPLALIPHIVLTLECLSLVFFSLYKIHCHMNGLKH